MKTRRRDRQARTRTWAGHTRRRRPRSTFSPRQKESKINNSTGRRGRAFVKRSLVAFGVSLPVAAVVVAFRIQAPLSQLPSAGRSFPTLGDKEATARAPPPVWGVL